MNINSTSSNSSKDYSRITGLATGMDIDAMVKQGLAGEQSKIDKVNQDVQYLKWQQEASIDAIKDLKEFNNFFDILKSDNMMLSSTYTGIKASSSAENIVTAKTLPGAITGNYKMEVSQLAEGAKCQATLGNSVTNITKLSDMGITAGNFKIAVGGKNFDINITDVNITLNDFMNNLKSIKSNDAVEANKVKLDKLVDVKFSEITKKLTFENKTLGSGADKAITITDNGSNIVSKLGLSSTPGNDAIIQLTAPGETTAVTITKNTNNFTLDNVSFNLMDKTEVGKPVIISVKRDATEAVDKFKKFVEKYNAIVEKFNGKISEKKQYTYKPLTDAQRSAMKDDEIKNWETAAKKGILRRDQDITKVLSGMRSAFYDKIKDAGISLQEIGISTTSNYSDGGKIKIDETKLKSALEEKGDLVQKLFTQVGTSSIPDSSTLSAADKQQRAKEIYETGGIFQRIKATLDTVIGSNGTLVKKAGYTDSQWASNNDLSKKINDKNVKLKSIQTKMTAKQQRLYSMYATLEKNMNKLNSQSSWLASNAG